MKLCYVFDIDGTLADCSHRVHHIKKDPKDWDAYFAGCAEDKPIEHMVDLVNSLFLSEMDIYVIYVSGRRESCRGVTEKWLKKQKLHHEPLYLRPDGDHTDDDILKIRILDRIRADGWEPVLAFDDRTRVVNAWRNAGIPCCQVAPGDF